MTNSVPDFLQDPPTDVAMVLGSGLGVLTKMMDVVDEIGFAEMEGIPASRVSGHVGRFLLAKFHGIPIVVADGRSHLYEGWSASEVARPIEFFHRIGIQKLLITNAAGSLNADFAPGRWMMLIDHLNLTGQSPLTGRPNFVDMSRAYSRRLHEIFRSTASLQGTVLHEGVYAGVLGPQYETPAEIQMLRTLGADAVGMSTVLEVIMARSLGMEVAAFSCLTNWGAGISKSPINHNEVLAAGRIAVSSFADMLRASLPHI